MERTQSQILPSEFLVLVATQAFDILLPIAIANLSASAAGIVTRLKYIAEDLSRKERYQWNSDIQKLSLQALKDLVDICNWTDRPSSNDCLRSKQSARDLYNLLVQAFKTPKVKDRERSIAEFCKERHDSVESIQSRFVELSDKITSELQDSGPKTIADSHLKPLERDVYPDTVNKLFFDGIATFASCIQTNHKTVVSQDSTDDWHHMRLCLDSGYRSQDHLALFNVVTATSEMVYWQELAVNVQIQDLQTKNTNEIQHDSDIAIIDPSLSLMRQGNFCQYLEEQSYSKICLILDTNSNLYEQRDPEELLHIVSGRGVRLSELLTRSELTVEHKVKLSYAIARAFWQFYNSEVMSTRWTSDEIIFIEPHEEFSCLKEVVPLRAFISLPFGTGYKLSPAESYDEGRYTHRYPRILYLGIMLLEIGLGRPLGLDHDTELNLLTHTNTAHSKARTKLQELKKLEWDGFQWKDCFIEAVENCLDYRMFNIISKTQMSHRGTNEKLFENQAKESLLAERRHALYRNVVGPLSWLATEGFKGSEEVPLVPLRAESSHKSEFLHGNEIQSFWSNIHENPSFNSGVSSNTEDFLDDLQSIAGHIKRFQRQAKIDNPIRVAILDTGCKRDLSFFETPQRSIRLKGWKDFTKTGSKTETDAYGHGTFMARLLMHVAPLVDIYLVRVAENSDDLEKNEANITKAIEYAGLDPEWKVDIISMSFGFPNTSGKTYPAISNAIEKVRRDRNDSVLFVASAGNSWQRGRDFPASHKDVIPIYAANSKGIFLDSNPSQTGKGFNVLGTYGTDIPPAIVEEVQSHFPEADLSAGSSIATAIAAGIVAMTLSYIAALPLVLNFRGIQQVCDKLYTKKGMMQMLYIMSSTKNYREFFINPVWFWGQKTNDSDIFCSICCAVEQTTRQEQDN